MFFGNYRNPGKGVNKRDPNQPRWQVFLDVFPRKLWDLFKLNLLYLFAALPFFLVTMLISGAISSPIINQASANATGVSFYGYDILLRIAFSFLFMVFIGMGPPTAGFAYVIREHANERPCMLVSDYFERFKSNFKQSIFVWLIDLVVLYVFSVSIWFYSDTGKIAFQYVFMVASLIYIMMHIYIYPMLITFDLPLNHIMKNSFLLALGKAPINLLITGCNIMLYILMPIYTVMHVSSLFALLIVLFVEVFILPPMTQFAINFCIIPILLPEKRN